MTADHRPTAPQRRARILTRTLVAAAALLLGLAAAPAASAAPPPTLSLSASSGLDPAGQTINVTGAGYKAGAALFVTVCDPAIPGGGGCDMEHYAKATVGPGGDFTAQLHTVAKFGSVDCAQVHCMVMTSNATNPADTTAQAGVPISFAAASTAPGTTTPKTGAKTTPPPSAGKATLALSASTGLDPAGQPVTVRGSGFHANTPLFVTVCDPSVPAGGACDTANFKRVETDAAGTFDVTLTVAAVFGTTDCAKTKCAVQTSSVADPTDSSQEAVAMVSFAAAAASPTSDPTTSAAPTTDPATSAATTSAASATPVLAGAPSDGGTGSGGLPAWLWVVIAIVVIALVAGAVVLVRRNRSGRPVG